MSVTPGQDASGVEGLRQGEELFRLLVESVKDYAIFVLDPAGNVATWNIGAARIYGLTAEEIVGGHFSRFYSEEEARSGKCECELEAAAKEGRLEDEGWRVRKDGTRFWANVVITPLRDQEGRLVGFAKVTRDLTERRRAEEARIALMEAARARVAIVAELSELLSGALSIEQVGGVVIDRGSRFTAADTCMLYTLDEGGRALELVGQRGIGPELVEQLRRIDEGSGNPVYEACIVRGEPVWMETAAQYEAFFPSLAHARVAGPRVSAFWAIPLVAEGERIGLLGMGFVEPRTFPDDERDFVVSFGRQSAQALARARRLDAERSARSRAERIEARLATTLRSIGDAVIATDHEGLVTLMNGVAESLTGFTEDEARGRRLTEVFHIVNEHTREVVVSPVDRVLRTGGIVGLANHTVLVARDGRETPIDDSGAPIRAAAGEIEGVVLVFRDVTERKREEERRLFLVDATAALSESLDYETTIAKVARLVVPRLADWCAVDVVVEGQRRPKRLAVAHVDPAKVDLAKELDERYPPDPFASSGVPNVLRTGRAELYRAIPDELLVAGCVDEEHLRIARALQLRSAMVVPIIVRDEVLAAITFVFAESGRSYTEGDLAFAEEVARRCAIAIENARLYASEQDARISADVANRAKDEFLAMVSHELRTPLNAIMGWAKLLTAKDFDATRRDRAAETIERNALAMAQLIEDLLDMSRVISGKMRLEVQPVDLARVVEAAIDSVRLAADAKSIRISMRADPHPKLAGDPTRLQQVAWNLLSNAVKFSPKGGDIEVGVGRAESWVELSVSDRGSGIAPQFLPVVFEPFRQEDATYTRSRGGLGLGLAISRRLVELHGGSIRADSAGEGKGATFTVRLPVPAIAAARGAERADRRDAEIVPSSADLERPAELRGIEVLVVEDDDDARSLISMILSDCGCRVTAVRGVDEAMSWLADHVPDVLLSDIAMPGRDGFDLIRCVRKLPVERGGDVPAAAVTAYARAEERRRMLDAGYSMHVSKPIEPAELVASVVALTRLSKKPR